MELIQWFVDFFLHLDRHLAEVIQTYGTWTYGLLFVIVFLETGLVVNVPDFIGQGTVIKVDTRTGEYLGRVN